MRLYVYSMREFDELPCFEKFCKKYGIEYDYTTETPCLANLDYCRGYEVVDIITTVIDRPMLDRFHELGVRCLATRTIGYDHIDTAYAKQLGIGVIHVSYSPNSVADYTIMMMLMGCRKLPHIMERAAVQDYTLKGKLGREIQDCTVGIIGTGRIGKTVIRHLSGFGCRMLAYDIMVSPPHECSADIPPRGRGCRPARAGRTGNEKNAARLAGAHESDEVRKYAQYVDLDTIYRECDIITLHAPATDDNYHMINAQAIEKMKQDVILINCARGALVDTDALIDGIESGKIGFAGLDVVEHESGLYYFNRMGEPLNNPKLAILRSYSNVLVSPHTAFYTDEAVANMAENSILGAMKFMNGEETPFLV